MEDLPTIHEKLDSKGLAVRLESVWENCERDNALLVAHIADDSGQTNTYHTTTNGNMRWHRHYLEPAMGFLATYVPRLIYAALSVSQIHLIQNAVAFVEGLESTSTGYGLPAWWVRLRPHRPSCKSHNYHPRMSGEQGLMTLLRS